MFSEVLEGLQVSLGVFSPDLLYLEKSVLEVCFLKKLVRRDLQIFETDY